MSNQQNPFDTGGKRSVPKSNEARMGADNSRTGEDDSFDSVRDQSVQRTTTANQTGNNTQSPPAVVSNSLVIDEQVDEARLSDCVAPARDHGACRLANAEQGDADEDARLPGLQYKMESMVPQASTTVDTMNSDDLIGQDDAGTAGIYGHGSATMAETQSNNRSLVLYEPVAVEQEVKVAQKFNTDFHFLSLLEELPVGIMTHVCEFLGLPATWRLVVFSESETLERTVTKECTTLWRHIHFVANGVARNVCEDTLTDGMVENLLRKVDARNITESIDFESCHQITGFCLRQLDGSHVLEKIHFAETADKLDIRVTTDLLRTSLFQKLVDVKFPCPPMTRHPWDLNYEEDRSAFRTFVRDLELEQLSHQKCICCRLCKGNEIQVAQGERVDVSYICPDCWIDQRWIDQQAPTPMPVVLLGGVPIVYYRSDIVCSMLHLCHTTYQPLETLYLAVSLADRYLQKLGTFTSLDVQMVFLASFSLICKHVEDAVHSPDVPYVAHCFKFQGRFVDEVTDLHRKVLKAKENITKTMENQIIAPTAYDFLSTFPRFARVDKWTYQLSSYVLTTTLFCFDFSFCPLDKLALAALLIAARTTKLDLSIPFPIDGVNYSYEEIVAVARDILSKKSQAENSFPFRWTFAQPWYGSLHKPVLFDDF